jgi:hypothetical protein
MHHRACTASSATAAVIVPGIADIAVQATFRFCIEHNNVVELLSQLVVFMI